jgi:hypothetical protein
MSIERGEGFKLRFSVGSHANHALCTTVLSLSPSLSRHSLSLRDSSRLYLGEYFLVLYSIRFHLIEYLSFDLPSACKLSFAISRVRRPTHCRRNLLSIRA